MFASYSLTRPHSVQADKSVFRCEYISRARLVNHSSLLRYEGFSVPSYYQPVKLTKLKYSHLIGILSCYITHINAPLSSTASASVSPRLCLDQHFKMLNVEKELFEAYAFYTAITVLKMVIMSFLTARQRFKTMTFISSEDAKQAGSKVCRDLH